jgi:putative heme transporter
VPRDEGVFGEVYIPSGKAPLMRRITFRGRLRRASSPGAEGPDDSELVEIDAGELTGVFAAPEWLRDLGIFSWLLVGVAAALAGAVWLLAITQTIVVPVIVAAIIASVAGPFVDWLARRRVPRAVGAGLVLLAIVVVGVGVALIVLSGIANETQSISARLQGAANTISGWLQDAGVDPQQAQHANQDTSAAVSDGFRALLAGLPAGISALASLAVFVTFTVLSLFFLLKDGDRIGAFAERHMGVPIPVGHTILARTAGSMREYFLGMTIVSAFSATIVGLGALVLGVDLAGTIFVVTFLGGYVPYLGAWTAGAFAVLIALGSSGPESAAALAVIILLANGALQQMVQPVAYGATLGIHPLAVLIVTIAGGSLFGAIGLILAAPLTAAAVKITADLARARAEDEAGEDEAPRGPPGSEASPSPA